MHTSLFLHLHVLHIYIKRETDRGIFSHVIKTFGLYFRDRLSGVRTCRRVRTCSSPAISLSDPQALSFPLSFFLSRSLWLIFSHSQEVPTLLKESLAWPSTSPDFALFLSPPVSLSFVRACVRVLSLLLTLLPAISLFTSLLPSLSVSLSHFLSKHRIYVYTYMCVYVYIYYVYIYTHI